MGTDTGHEYFIQYGNQAIRFSVALDPIFVRSCLQQLYGILKPSMNADIKISFDGDEQQDLWAKPVQDAVTNDFDSVMVALARSVQVETVEDLHEYQAVGERLLKRYRVWKRQTDKVGRDGQRSLENGDATANLQLIDELVLHSSEHLQIVFDLKMRKACSVEHCMRELHVASATFHRYWRQLKCELGQAVTKRYSSEEVFYSSTQYESQAFELAYR